MLCKWPQWGTSFWLTKIQGVAWQQQFVGLAHPNSNQTRSCLVGGLEHVLLFFHWRTPSFFKMVTAPPTSCGWAFLPYLGCDQHGNCTSWHRHHVVMLSFVDCELNILFFNIYHLVMTNIAMENPWSMEVSSWENPLKMATWNYQRV